MFPTNDRTAKSFAALKGARDHEAFPNLANLRKVGLELVAYAGEVRVDGRRPYVVAHIDGVETERVGCWFYGKIVKSTEFKI